MPRPPALVDVRNRFFARIDRFVCECPDCGTIIHAAFPGRVNGIRVDAGRHSPLRRRDRSREAKEGRRPHRNRAMTYNPLSSRLSCPSCRRTFAIGLLAYPVARYRSARQPADQKPTLAQLRAIRQYAGGYYLKTVIAGDDQVNIAVVAECICPEETQGWAVACPVHGWEATRDREGIATTKGPTLEESGPSLLKEPKEPDDD